MYKKVLVAIDGSEQSNKALDHAVAIAEKFGSELVLLTVIPTLINQFFPMIAPFSPDASFSPKAYTKYQERMSELYHNTLKEADARAGLSRNSSTLGYVYLND